MTPKTIELTNAEDVKEILLHDKRNLKIENIDISNDTDFDISFYLRYNPYEVGVDAEKNQEIDIEGSNNPKNIFLEEIIVDDKIRLETGFTQEKRAKTDNLYEATKDLSYKVVVSYTLN